MFQKPPTPPTEPRSRRGGRNGIQKRNRAPVRVDKDGDLDMDVASTVKKARSRALRESRESPRIRGNAEPGSGRDMNATDVQKAILRGMGSGDGLRRGYRPPSRSGKQIGKALGRERNRDVGEELTQINVRGLKNSKAASNPDGGIKDLLAFLERKASAPDASAREMVKIKKVCLTSCTPGHQRRRVFGLSGPLSFQVKLSERRL